MPNPSFTLMTPTTSDAQKIAQVVQSMAKDAGFDVKIQSTEFATSLNMADKGDFEAYVLAWSGRADPDGNIFSFAACKQPLNYSGYCKPEVDDLLTKSRTTLDPAERKKIYEQIAAILLKDRPVIYLFHRHWLWAYTTKLTGLRTIPDGLVRVQGLKHELSGAVIGRESRCDYLAAAPRRTIVPTLFFVSILIFGLQQLLPGDPAMILAGEERDPTVDRLSAPEAAPRRAAADALPATGSGGVLHGRPRRIGAHPEAGARSHPREAAGHAGAGACWRSSSRSRSASPPASSRRSPRDTVWDYAANVFALWGLSTPNFWLGIMLILLFSVHAGLAAGLGLREPVRGPQGQPRGDDHAGVRARQRDRRGADAPHAQRHAAGAQRRLRAHRARQGPRRARRRAASTRCATR